MKVGTHDVNFTVNINDNVSFFKFSVNFWYFLKKILNYITKKNKDFK